VIGYTARRLGIAVVLLWILSVITFAIYLKVPADPAGFLVDIQHASPEQIAKATEIEIVSPHMLDPENVRVRA
jgi:ABC-type dipeptide/oligopeptide/nickel transport system permease component